VLYCSEVQWRSQVSRKHLMVRRFPADWEVLFLSPVNLAPGENSFVPRRDRARSGVRYWSLPLPKPDARSGFLRSLTPLLSATGRGLIAGVASDFGPDVTVCSNIWAAPAAAALRARGVPVVYDLNDLHPEFYPTRRAQAEERFRGLIACASEVVCSSRRLRDIAGRGVVIGNGVDLDTFRGQRDMPPPDPLARSPLASCEDLVMYVGSVDDRIDPALLERLLENLTAAGRSAGLVLIGRVFDAALPWKAELERRFGERVLFTGRVPYEELPRYLSRAAVGIAPFLANAKTAAINPNKLYMYAAMNANVVSTPFSAEVEDHRGVIFVASDRDAFAAAVLEAMDDGGRRAVVRARIAEPNSWDALAARFVALLEGLTAKPGS
jgi:glycosyltransferase involved in cell wall biosynthesis